MEDSFKFWNAEFMHFSKTTDHFQITSFGLILSIHSDMCDTKFKRETEVKENCFNVENFPKIILCHDVI